VKWAGKVEAGRNFACAKENPRELECFPGA